MKKLKALWFWILPLLKNKYTLTLIVFLGWLTFFDQNNLLDRIQTVRQLHGLENDKQFYINKIKSDSMSLRELKTDKKNLERFAREKYLMKRKNEDIFIISD